MTTTSDLIAATERLLLSGAREERNYLAADYASGGATIQIANAAGNITAGARLAIGIEMFMVKTTPTDSNVSVIGAQEGSAAANHLTGATITVNPKFSQWSILGALNSELSSLSSPGNGLYQTLTKDLTFDASVIGYDLGTSSFLDVYEVRWKLPGVSKYWPRVSEFEVDRSALTSDFASTTALYIEGATDAQPIRVTYFAGFTALAALTDDVLAVAGLPATCHDIPPYGAADILVSSSEARRNFIDAQADSKRLEEVPTGAMRQSGLSFRQIHDRRVREEASRLRKANPTVRNW